MSDAMKTENEHQQDQQQFLADFDYQLEGEKDPRVREPTAPKATLR